MTYLKSHFPSDGIESLADLKLQHWKAYTKSIDPPRPSRIFSPITLKIMRLSRLRRRSWKWVLTSIPHITFPSVKQPHQHPELDVAGTVTATAAIFSGDVAVNTNTLFVNATTSNVGIGTVTPGYTLDVAGDINLSGTFNQNGAPFASSPWTTTGTDLSYTTGSISGDGSGLTTLNASNISSGTVAAARIPTLNQNTTGSAATLTTPRTIGGVSFNGSAAINLPGVNTPGNQNTTGSAGSATTAGSVSTSVTPGSYLTGSAYNGSTARTFAVDATTAATASKIVARDGSGHIFANYLNMSHGATARNSDTVFYSSTDNYIRKTTAAGMRSSLGLKNSATTTATDADTASTVVMRNGSGDMFARLFRSDYQNQSDCGAGIAFRNSTSDNYIRFCTNMGNVRSRIGCYGNGSNITRTSHSNGYMVGSYNSVGGNDAKTNPIYTIGSNYQPSDTSLSNMYGIGYSHGNFTSILTGGWGMYVAADGDARIGLNGSNGNIKCTGYITAGGNVTAYSDIRGKENIKRIENPLERIEKMNGYIYNKKEEPTKKYTGVVAQELLEVLPEVVEGNEKDGYAVAYGNFAGIFIEAIKELKAQLQVEKSRNDRLEALMTTFNSRLDNVN